MPPPFTPLAAPPPLAHRDTAAEPSISAVLRPLRSGFWGTVMHRRTRAMRTPGEAKPEKGVRHTLAGGERARPP